MGFFLRWATAITATVSLSLPVLVASSSSSSPPTSVPFSGVFKSPNKSLRFLPSPQFSTARALCMDAPSFDRDIHPQDDHAALPDVLTEYMVEMKCQGCADTAKNKLAQLHGVKNIQVDLQHQIVRILGSASVKDMSELLGETQMKAILIGQGNPEDFLVSAAVAEFKGPEITGVVRIVQVSMERARVEGSFTGLRPLTDHRWAINQYGNLTRGAASTGGLFSPQDCNTHGEVEAEPVGDLGRLTADEEGGAFYTATKPRLKVGDVIGRAVVIYRGEEGVAAAVIARSAGVGENPKNICTCDGTTIWDFTPPTAAL